MLIVKLYREQGVNKVVSERYPKNAYQQQLDRMEQVCVDDSVNPMKELTCLADRIPILLWRWTLSLHWINQ